MNRSTRTCLAAWSATALLLTGCGSAQTTEATSSATETPSSTDVSASSSKAAPSTAAPAANPTVGDYLKEIGVTPTFIKAGEPGTPQLNLPTPTGWRNLGPDTPKDAWGGIVLDDPTLGNDVPAIIARLAKLSGGQPDPAKILELAPNQVRNLPGYKGPDAGTPSSLGGFEAVDIKGTTVRNGKTLLVARKTVVITGQDGLYLLALDAQGPQGEADALGAAMATIDSDTTIEP
jgi:hypothetical protein